MMKRKQELKPKPTANVEFGNEFGDINAAKMYERAFPKKKKGNKQ
jgi:hypothetical protein